MSLVTGSLSGPPRATTRQQADFTFLPVSRRKRRFKVGPGYPLPLPAEEDDLWKGKEDQVKYLPLQAQEGDLAIFLQKGAIEVMYEEERYFIVPQASILMLEREEDL